MITGFDYQRITVADAVALNVAALWRAWAPDLQHTTVTSGHFMAEEAPADVIKALRTLLLR